MCFIEISYAIAQRGRVVRPIIAAMRRKLNREILYKEKGQARKKERWYGAPPFEISNLRFPIGLPADAVIPSLPAVAGEAVPSADEGFLLRLPPLHTPR
jgi:hypothetical protein